jgi:hypothetical protein
MGALLGTGWTLSICASGPCVPQDIQVAAGGQYDEPTAPGDGAPAHPRPLPDSKHANTAQLCILTHRLKLTDDLPVVAVTHGQRGTMRDADVAAYGQEADGVLAECLTAMGFRRADIALICGGGCC